MTSYTPTNDDPVTGLPKVDSVYYWSNQVKRAEQESGDWHKQAKDAYQEYAHSKAKDVEFKWRSITNERLPYFWSNIQTLQPALYSRTPVTVIKRRFNDADPVGKVASQVLERLGRYLVDTQRFDRTMERLRDDYLIAGLGTLRAYYEIVSATPERVYLSEGVEVPEGTEILEDEAGSYIVQPGEDEEKICLKWVPYKDVLWSPGARTWDDVEWVALRHFMDKAQFSERFGEKKRLLIPFCYSSKQIEKVDEKTEGEFCQVIEIWNKKDRKIRWYCPDYAVEFLDTQDDIYELREFFPVAEPVLSTISDNSLCPVPDYIQYRTCLETINYLANRQKRLIRALRARGVYDATQEAIQRLVTETSDADLVPVDNLMALLDKGGLENSIRFVDTGPIATALLQTYEAMEQQKQVVYEITGLSDIVRGVSNPGETATAQQLKGNFASIRLQARQREIQRIARDGIELMCDLALSKLSDRAVWEMAGVAFLPPDEQELFGPALQLLRSDKFRTFRIEIETDSTVALDSDIDKQMRMELLGNVGQFFQQAVAISQAAPQLLPGMADVILHALRGFRQSSAIETSVETSMEQFRQAVEQALAQPQEPPPDPKMIEVQVKQQIEQMRMQVDQAKLQIEQAKLQLEQQIAEAKMQVEQQKLAQDLQVEQMKAQAEVMKVEKQAEIEAFKLQIEAQRPQVEQSVAAAPQPVALTVNVPEPKMRKVVLTTDPETGARIGIVETINNVGA